MSCENPLSCPLCVSSSVVDYWSDINRDYYQCNQCSLVFVPSWQCLSVEEEKAVYDLHQNDPGDLGYRKFLSRLVEPLIKKLSVGGRGLDFGSGPGPTLPVMLKESGFDTAVYDIFYANYPAVLQVDYHFITATEVVEHLSQPGVVLNNLWAKIKPDGYLAIMTKLVLNKQAFSRWHHKNDPTHICFYSRKTFGYLCQKWGAVAEYPADDVILICKKPEK